MPMAGRIKRVTVAVNNLVAGIVVLGRRHQNHFIIVTFSHDPQAFHLALRLEGRALKELELIS